ncbi:zinc finger protein 62 homolog [Cololabis saira]|uniref:zinc finger protein 62 homolog n=1 Tax=Cololabis saira TaxID=129043 RepID=UPI002AD4A381|nr:zinc finger protein 62 homolog [Cololabis saira]
MRFGLQKTFTEKTVEAIQSSPFSLNLDEATTASNKKVVTFLVSYFSQEQQEVVVEHLDTVELKRTTSQSLFDALGDVFERMNIPWRNLVSVLMDSCSVMRGWKNGLEAKIREKIPHLLNIDGDSCHHIHNCAKEFCKPFGMWLEVLFNDLHTDFKWTPEFKDCLREIAAMFNQTFTAPERFIPHRWLSAYDVALSTARLLKPMQVFYYSFLKPDDKELYEEPMEAILNHNEICPIDRNRIREIQRRLASKTGMTENGKNRKKRIVNCLFFKQKKTVLQLNLYLSVLPLLKEYVMVFQTQSLMIHKLHDRQEAVFRKFLACYVRPEKFASLHGRELKEMDISTDKGQFLPTNKVFVNETIRTIVRASSDVIGEEFLHQMATAYKMCGKKMQEKLPLHNKVLRTFSATDPECRPSTAVITCLKHLCSCLKDVSPSQYEAACQQCHHFVADKDLPAFAADDRADIWWGLVTKKYPDLGHFVLAAYTCFRGPQVESSFSSMKGIMNERTGQMNVKTLSAYQTGRYGLKAHKASAISMFGRKNILHEPIPVQLCRNIRSAAAAYRAEKEEKRQTSQAQTTILLTKAKARELREKAMKTMDTENQFCSPTEMETVVNSERCQKHSLVCATVSPLDKCLQCVGPVSSLKWLGYKCRELPQENVCKVEEDGVSSDQHLDNLERSCSPDQEEPGHPQTTELEEDSSGQEMKHEDVEVDVSLVNVADVKVENGEPGPNCGQLLLHTSPEAQNKDEEGTESLRSDSSKTADPEPMRRHGDHEDAAVPSDSNCKSKLIRTHTGKKVFSCSTCRKEFSNSSNLMDHMKIHTGERLYLCNTCDKTFTYLSYLKRHITTHTGEKPYICKTCGKSYRLHSHLVIHSKTHMDEKPYICKTCGKSYKQRCHLVVHSRTHTGERPHVCSTCSKTFTISSDLKRHITTHTGEKPYICKTCGKSYRLRSHLLVHSRIHTGEKPYLCNTCGKTFTQLSALKSHITTHTGEKPYMCKTCGKSYTERCHLVVHSRIHTGERPYLCNICGKTFTRSSNLKSHITTHTGEKPYICKTCGNSYKQRCNLVVHSRTHTGERPHVCSTCSKTFTNLSDLKRHITTHTGEKPYICKTCGKSYKQHYSLVFHSRTHTGEKLYLCKTCNKGFGRRIDLLSHMKNHPEEKIHTGERPYLCNTCGKSFRKSSMLKKHKMIHKGEKLYICKTCGKSYTQRSTLVIHSRTHTGERPYPCNTCSKTFTNLWDLRRHITTHTGEKPYICKTCGKSYRQDSHLLVHSRIHTGERRYLCNIGGKSFINSSHLKRHITTHTGEKPYICKTCGKSYTERYNLVVHSRTHSGERPYLCNTCSKTFTRSSHLKSHINTHTGEKRYLCKTCNKGFSRRMGLLSHMKNHPE